ncbi:hypothetical protein BH10ACT6_BH10ACT6_09300 [soil metagenome]
MVCLPVQGSAKRIKSPALELFDGADALPHHLSRLVERKTSDDSQADCLALFLAERMQKGKNPVTTDIVHRELFRRGGPPRVDFRVERDAGRSDGAGAVVVDEARVGDGEGHGAHAVITSCDALEVLVESEEYLVGERLGVIDPMRPQVAEN